MKMANCTETNFLVCPWCGHEYKGERDTDFHLRCGVIEFGINCEACGEAFLYKLGVAVTWIPWKPEA